MKKVFLLSLLAALAACASILQGNRQHVSIRLEPDVAGNCTVAERYAPKQTVIVPGEADISRSYYPMDISCTTDHGALKGQAIVYSDVSGLGYTGAVAGLGVGAVVDAATSDAFDYPYQIVVKTGQITEIGKNSMNDNVEFDK